jgi:hypothetical protein
MMRMKMQAQRHEDWVEVMPVLRDLHQTLYAHEIHENQT